MRRLGAVSPQPPAWRAARYPSSRRSPRSSSARRGPRRGRGRHETKLLSRRRWRYLAEDSPEVVVLLERGDEPVFVAGSLAWGIVADGSRPDRWDYFGATICLAGVAVIMFAPRTA